MLQEIGVWRVFCDAAVNLDRSAPPKVDLQPQLAEQLVNDLNIAHLGRDGEMQHGFDLTCPLPRLS